MLPLQSRIFTIVRHEIMRSDGANSSMMPTDEEKARPEGYKV